MEERQEVDHFPGKVRICLIFIFKFWGEDLEMKPNI